ncbi:sensor histidine kinase [Sporomusa termitida]|uniref:histidine kinase n=1 Tax=Sporomusa termitida TaxID=2377 RepID=A0A517DZE6_9FIRM|nr:HAMP domain-containing sensor histidine kinase [Sporomusa termitida]QDR82626.1 Adaptive-response sensory-kinase SasA [Sporomusa termitida]
MLQRTLTQLTIINSFVFFIIYFLFTAILYGYLSYRLFDRIDEAMRWHASEFRFANGQVVPLANPIFDPRIFVLMRSTDGRTLNPVPFREEELKNIAEITAAIEVGELTTEEYEGHSYRMMSWPYTYQENIYDPATNFQIDSIIVISIVDSEVQLLNNCLWLIVSGGVISVFGIVLAGFLLAKRAMFPIQAAWEKQQQFVSDVSHELRSPLTGIYSNAELMLRYPDRSIREECHRINAIMQESKRMTKLIASLLTLARSDSGKSDLSLGVINLSAVVHEVVSHFEVFKELNDISLAVTIAPAVEIIGDKDRLHQLLVILLDNAFKFTPAGGQVAVACHIAKKNAIVSVSDTGVGIVPENVPRIFDRFFRGDKSRSRNAGGTGLGLAIAQWIVEKHGGRIDVKSSLGKGTNFIVSFPLPKKTAGPGRTETDKKRG